MVFTNCSNCSKPIRATEYKFILSDRMLIRIYKKVCPHCKKELEFFWHENSDQIDDYGKFELDV